jgi:perosamine synthetase
MPTSYEPGAPTPDGFIPLCVPHIQGNAWTYVKECLDTNWVSSVGPFVERFERQVAAYTGAQYGVATVSGTAALHIALLVAGVQPDDEVLVSTLTFIAPVNAIRYCGAWPVFIDAEPQYWQLDPQKVADFLEQDCAWEAGELRNRSTGRRVKAILPVHILGHPVNIDPILALARVYHLPVIEDATEGLGACYQERRVGSLGDIACFSFNGNKIITTGGGGIIVTDQEAWARKARYLTTQAKDDPLEYIHYEIGFNYRLTNMQAALGCAQMEQLDEYIAIKRRIAQQYQDAFQDTPGITPMPEAPWASSTFWLYTVLVDETEYGMDSRALLGKLNSAGIQSRPLWQPIHLSPAHAGHAYECPVAENLYRRALSLPCSVGLTEAQQAKVIAAVRE